LRERGVRKGDRVAVSLGNGWEFAVATYAIWKLGAILVCPFVRLSRNYKSNTANSRRFP